MNSHNNFDDQPLPTGNRSRITFIAPFVVVLLAILAVSIFAIRPHLSQASPPTMIPTQHVTMTQVPLATDTAIPTPTATATIPATATSVALTTCNVQYPIQSTYQEIPLPPQTHVGSGNAMTGEAISLLCSDAGTSDSINQYLATALIQAGWHVYDPAKDVNGGCSYVNWVKGKNALDWGFGTVGNGPLSKAGSRLSWFITLCGRMNP